MPTTGQLQLGLTEVYAPGTNTVIGYAFTEQSGAGQLQRWILFDDPENALEVRKPSAQSPITATTLGEWRDQVGRLVRQRWQPDWRYVWAQADVYSHGGTSGSDAATWTWTQIPPASRMPMPTYPDVDADCAQLDPDCKALEIVQNAIRGLVYTSPALASARASASSASTVEYWLLLDEYAPAGGLKPTTVGAAGGRHVTLTDDPALALQKFIDLANASWKPGCAFVITGCVNHTGQFAPTNL
ncbi:hypothetical protein [Sorangium sp. So ce542]|uniref:hypothetical protein n=1 Tax=Sorangium sp. So ce542 TaxID=3133316 RepID=UPI003F5DAD40